MAMEDSRSLQKLSARSEISSPKHRVVITGIGAITPLGNTIDESWQGLVDGRSGVVPITVIDTSNYPCRIGGEPQGFDPLAYMSRKKARHIPFAAQLAIAASMQAIEDARLDLNRVNRDEIGVIIGTAGGSSLEETEKATLQLHSSRGRRLSPFQVLRLWPNIISYSVAECHHFRGHNLTVCTACASGTQAVGEAARVIRHGGAEIMITGGSESMVSETVLAGFVAMRALATSYNECPEKGMRPFDADREGFVPAIGTTVMVLESLEHALARGAQIYAEILGSGASNDAFHMIAPDPVGGGAALAIERSLADAGIAATGVDYINAHAASTPLGDVAETEAIKMAFGEYAYDIPISSTKSMMGHLMGAAGAIEAAVCAMTLRDGMIHPTINYETMDPGCDLDYVPNEARTAEVKIAMSNSFGLGGQNACLVMARM